MIAKFVLTDIDVVILCGGKGKRLRSILSNKPKALADINGVPFAELLIDFLSFYGFRRFIFCIGYKGNQIKEYFKKKANIGKEIIFSTEKMPLGTAGAVKNARRLIKSNPFLVVNGDTICSLNYKKFIDLHLSRQAELSVVLNKSDPNKDCGTVTLDSLNRMVKFQEKKDSRGRCAFINAGIYLMDRAVLSKIPSGKNFSLEYELMPRLVNGKYYGFVTGGEFIDIGTPDNYQKAKKVLKKMASNPGDYKNAR